MMNADYYIVQVQDFGELLEYRYDDYAKAHHLMEAEALPCSLWACRRATNERIQLESRTAASQGGKKRQHPSHVMP